MLVLRCSRTGARFLARFLGQALVVAALFSSPIDNFDRNRDRAALFRDHPINVFLLKLND